MMTIRPAAERGAANFGWLDSRHSFSFGRYYDPAHMGFGPLRVINEDRITPGAGFDPHGHQDMEIISYVLEGALEHKDSIGTGSVILPGEIQRMSAGTGIRHSEYNHSQSEGAHFLQIWIMPDQEGLEPSYEQRQVPDADKQGQFTLIASPNPSGNAVKVHQDVQLYAGVLGADDHAELTIEEGRLAWVQIARGSVTLNGQRLEQGDGAALRDETTLIFEDGDDAEILVFDMTR